MPLFRRNVTKIGESGDQVSGSVELVQGSNMTITRSGQAITFASSGGGGSGSSISKAFTQVAHGFAVQDAITPNDSGTWVKADADNETLMGIGIVSAVADADNFTVVFSGYISGLSGLTAGANYFVSQTAGALTATEPSFPAYSNPLLLALSTTEGIVMNQRAWLNGDIVDGGAFGDSDTEFVDGGAF